MKILYYDCFSGISGDMNLGALVDLGVSEKYLKKELSGLNMEEEYTIDFIKSSKMGISGTKTEIKLTNKSQHPHRHFSDIIKLIDGAGFSEKIKKQSKLIFRKIAEAEVKVHDIDIEKVHFHEIGAVDSILDIIGAVICLDYLEVDRIVSSPLELGRGFVKCDHGVFPVPAPAAIEILKDIPVKSGRVDGEATTPTGAAIIAVMAEDFGTCPDIRVKKIGYGIGHSDFKIPNVLRVILGEASASQKEFSKELKTEKNILIETNIDDMTPEDFEPLFEILLENGALDVYLTGVLMKKSRPAIKLSVLLKPENRNTILDLVFKHTTTLGLRIRAVDKLMIDRQIKKINTSLGPVSIKMGKYGGFVKMKAEYEDIKKLAIEHKKSILEVRNIINREIFDNEKN